MFSKLLKNCHFGGELSL